MGLKTLIVRLQCRTADTPDTPEKNTGYQCKAPIHAGCTSDTPDTPRFSDTRAILQFEPFAEAVNDPSPPSEPPADPSAWRELAQAYHEHHFDCGTCIAAGRGSMYGLRCGTGAALWSNYQNT